MRMFQTLLFVLASAGFAQGKPAPNVPNDVAAMHGDGEWRVRKADLYRHLVAYNGGAKSSLAVLEDYLKRRLVEEEARKRELAVSENDVDAWLDALRRKVRETSGGTQTLEDMCNAKGMSMAELDRRARLWVLQSKLAQAVFHEKDPTRPRDKPVSDDSVVMVVDTLYQDAKKEYDPANLKSGVVARIGDVEVTTYEYGRELSFSLPKTEVNRALNDLILVEQTNQLLGEGDANREDLEAQKKWFLELERNRLRRMRGAPRVITDDIIDQWLESRGLTREKIFSNPAFIAEARLRGHFQRAVSDEELAAYHEKNAERFGAQVEVQRILVAARQQAVPGVGKKVRNLEQGKALADAIWLRVTGGEDFAKVAKANTDDPETIKNLGGHVPLWLTAATPGYQRTFEHANRLPKVGDIAKPFYDEGRGYVIVKLLGRRAAKPFDDLRPKLRKDAGEEALIVWKSTAVRDAVKNPSIGQ